MLSVLGTVVLSVVLGGLLASVIVTMITVTTEIEVDLKVSSTEAFFMALGRFWPEYTQRWRNLTNAKPVEQIRKGKALRKEPLRQHVAGRQYRYTNEQRGE